MIVRQEQLSHNDYFSQGKRFDKVERRALTLTQAQRDVFSYLMRYFDRYQTTQVSQIRIAHDLNLSRQTVNECIAHLTKIKFIGKITRYKMTCIYSRNAFFKDKENWRRLGYIFRKARTLLNPILLRSRNIINSNNHNPTVISYSSYYSYSLFPSSSNSPVSFSSQVYVCSKKTLYEASRAYTHSARAYVRDCATLPKKTGMPSKVAVMSDPRTMIEYMITPTIREATTLLNLTKWGQITLIPFPEEVLKQVLTDLKRSPNVKKQFGWLFNRLKSYCRTHDIEIKWKEYYLVRDAYKMPDNAPMTLQPVTNNHESGTKSHDLISDKQRFARPDIRTEAPQEDPHDVIYWWEQWVASDIFPKASAIAGPVSPHVANVIINKQISDERIEQLYAKYSFLKPHIEALMQRRLSHPDPDRYTITESIGKIIKGDSIETQTRIE